MFRSLIVGILFCFSFFGFIEAQTPPAAVFTTIVEAYCLARPFATAWNAAALPAKFFGDSPDDQLRSRTWTIWFEDPNSALASPIQIIVQDGIASVGSGIGVLFFSGGIFPASFLSGQDALALVRSVPGDGTVPIVGTQAVYNSFAQTWYWGVGLATGATVTVKASTQGDTTPQNCLPSCQTLPTQTFPQYQNATQFPYQPVTQYPPLMLDTSVPPYFGFLPSQNSATVLCPTLESGCALASTATMLTSFSSLASTTPTLLDCQLRGDTRCGASRVLYGMGESSLCPTSSPNCNSSQRVSYPDQCEFGPSWSGIQQLYPNAVTFVGSGQLAQNKIFDQYQGTSVSLDQYLSDNVCRHQNRVVLQLNEYANGGYAGQHYVFVTGQSTNGSDWNVFDPGWRSAPSTLGAHETGFTTPNAAGASTFRQFSVGGVRTYQDSSSMGNTGAISVVANSPIELLITDPSGNRLGNLNGTDVFEIPNASYVRDFPFADDNGTGASNGDPSVIKTAHIPSPPAGTYAVMVTGTALGTYSLTFRLLASDGTVQSATFAGVANAGSTSTYQLPFAPAPGGSGPVAFIATFGSTLADISNCMALGLIDNRGIANALSSQITAASASASTSDAMSAKDILSAAIGLLDAQTGKHLKGIAPQVLLADVNSLFKQL